MFLVFAFVVHLLPFFFTDFPCCGMRSSSFYFNFFSCDQTKEKNNDELSNSRWKSGSAVLQGSVVVFIELNRLTETTSIELEMSKCEECIWIRDIIIIIFFFPLCLCFSFCVSSICTN